MGGDVYWDNAWDEQIDEYAHKRLIANYKRRKKSLTKILVNLEQKKLRVIRALEVADVKLRELEMEVK